MKKETDPSGIPFKLKFDNPINELDPGLMSVCANLITFPQISSPTRIFMVGNMIPKSVRTNGADRRRQFTGFEKQYGDQCRKIEAPSHMIVEQIFKVESIMGRDEDKDAWSPYYVVFRNDEKNMFDILEMPGYNVQNTSVGFEYEYDKKVMRRMAPQATFPKGTIFARSPGVDVESGEWMFSTDLVVAAGSFFETEEDAVFISQSCADEKLACMFHHIREFGWNEDEFVPIMPYGTDENPSPYPQSGEVVRADGVVMGFRRRVPEKSLVMLTKKALRSPDHTHDILFIAPPGCEVMQVEVVSERLKNRSNNRSQERIKQQHTNLLESYEHKQNEMWNNVMKWYNSRCEGDKEPRCTNELKIFITRAMASITRNLQTDKINTLGRGFKNQPLKDWNVKIRLKETVPARARFKIAGLNADKGIIVVVKPDHEMPSYADGTTAQIGVNNTPAFRRQIYSLLVEQGTNFISNQVHKEIRAAHKAGDWKTAYALFMKFTEAAAPDYARLVEQTLITDEDKELMVDEVAKTKIRTQFRSDASVVGVQIPERLHEVFSYKPERAYITNVLGERVLTDNPVLITNQSFLLLDKFGKEASAQSFPISNPFGMPGKPNEDNKYGSFLSDKGNRNLGETEARGRISQTDGKEVVKQLAMAYSPEIRVNATQRIIRADDPFDIDLLVYEEEYEYNRVIRMASSMLSDSGTILRREQTHDRTDGGYPVQRNEE